MQEEVLNFIKKKISSRLQLDKWQLLLFALILSDRFNGSLYYDVIQGHFVCKIEDKYYDYNGIYSSNVLIEWKYFYKYDKIQYERIIRDVLN